MQEPAERYKSNSADTIFSEGVENPQNQDNSQAHKCNCACTDYSNTVKMLNRCGAYYIESTEDRLLNSDFIEESAILLEVIHTLTLSVSLAFSSETGEMIGIITKESEVTEGYPKFRVECKKCHTTGHIVSQEAMDAMKKLIGDD